MAKHIQWITALILMSAFACTQQEGTTGESDSTSDGDADSDTDLCGGAEYFTDWEAGKSPEEIGQKLANLFDSDYPSPISGPLQDDSNGYSPYEVHYKTACTWYGALDVADLIGNQDLEDRLVQKYTTNESVFEEYFNSYIFSNAGHVDKNVFGIVPLEVYLQSGDDSALEDGVGLADHQIQNKDDPNQKRYVTDDMFMVIGLQVQAYRATGDNKYLDFAAERMVDYLDRMQEPNDGCFYQQAGADAKWGRGNGWFASGMAEMLRELAPSHSQYPKILDSYQKMMAGLLNYQITSGDGIGLWYQVIDSTDPGNWPETSGSAMFADAMITGVKLCILDADTYGPAARSAWSALINRLDPDGKLSDISNWCYWQPSEGDALTYYITMDGRSKVTGDGHGQAPMLWTAAALLR